MEKNNELQVFWQLHLYGKRFTQHTFPLDCRKEIIGLKDILQRVATQEFCKKNDRMRIPANFNKNVSIAILDISKSSAIVSFSLVLEPTTFTSEAFAAYESAKRAIITVISQASEGEPITALPKEMLRVFIKSSLLDTFGRGLSNDEYILLDTAQNGHQIIFTYEIREKNPQCVCAPFRN